MYSRRQLLSYGSKTAVVLGTTTILPFAAKAAEGDNTFKTNSDQIVIHPVNHASFVMETPTMTIYNDPVGGADAYSDFPKPDLILVSHEHGDHFDVETLSALVGDETKILTNPAVYGMLPDGPKGKAMSIGNGESTEIDGLQIDAIPAYNTTEERLKYHPKGRDNGYVLLIDGLRVYIAGDTEDIAEMRALENIDLAFLPMNLPYTMDVEQAASAIAAFEPRYVYPYHYRDSDVARFAALVDDGDSGTEVLLAAWYG
jgi:L-ascorbate metabolism protein UlaG (beta-lactamase superfamily)